jgi:hypothetical protein
MSGRTRLLAAVASAILIPGCHSEPDYDGRPIAAWYADLRDTSAAKRAHAAEIIAQAAPDHPESVDRLLAALESESDTSLHVILANALGDAVSKHDPSPAVFASLARLTADEHQSVRTAAAIALARVVNASPANQPISTQAANALTAMFQAADDETRAAAADAVGAIASVRPNDAVPFARSLGQLVRADPVLLVRLDALQAFVRIPTSDDVAVPVYASAIHDGWPSMVSTAMKGLGRAPRVAGLLVDSILPVLQSDDVVTRIMAIRALAAIPAKASLQTTRALQRAAVDRDSMVQAEARLALKGLGAARP